MAGEHHHHGALAPEVWNRAFAIGVLLNTAFVVVEGFAGWWGDSLALVADAGHNLTDVLSLLLAWSAAMLATRRPTAYRTYGFSRASILAALFSAMLLMIALGVMIWEAALRLSHPVAVDGWLMIVVAGIGAVVNAATALLLRPGGAADLNLRGAYLHMVSDAAISLAVAGSGGAILLGAGQWLDPATSLLVAVFIVSSAWSMLRESLDLAVDAVPRGIDPHAVEQFLGTLPGVTSVHDLHIWGMSTTRAALTAHLVVRPPLADDSLLARAREGLERRFGIGHVTVQFECAEPRLPCVQESAESV